MQRVLEGQVCVDTKIGTDKGEVAILGAGQLTGEVALQGAALGRQVMQHLLEERPAVAPRLMTFIGQRVAEKLRAVDAQLLGGSG